MRKLALVVLLAGCGDDGVRHTPDASPRDGATDSPVADAAPNPVTLAAVYNGTPVAGVKVYFQNADSSLVLATTTDATGTASAVMQPGGYVTAVNPYALGGTDQLDTFAGVKPGDHLVLKAATGSDVGITMNVTAPSDGLLNYNVYSPCNNGGTPITPPAVKGALGVNEQGQITLFNCGAATDFLVIADDGATSFDYLYAPNIAVTDQGTADLTASTYTATTLQTLTYTNLPSAQSLSIEEDVLDPMGLIYTIGNETPAGDPTTTLHVPDFAGSKELLQTRFDQQAVSFQVLFDWGQLGAAFTTDVASRALHDFTARPALDPATHTATIAEAATGGAADFSVVAVSATRAQRSWSWSVIAPYSASGVTLPTLPTDVFDFNIAAADSFGVDSWANGKVPGGYDAVRALALASTSPTDLALGGSGAASFVVLQPPPTLAHERVLRHRTRER